MSQRHRLMAACPRGCPMADQIVADRHIKPELLRQFGLLDIPYPVQASSASEVTARITRLASSPKPGGQACRASRHGTRGASRVFRSARCIRSGRVGQSAGCSGNSDLDAQAPTSAYGPLAITTAQPRWMREIANYAGRPKPT